MGYGVCSYCGAVIEEGRTACHACSMCLLSWRHQLLYDAAIYLTEEQGHFDKEMWDTHISLE